jgi:hypothetical protein
MATRGEQFAGGMAGSPDLDPVARATALTGPYNSVKGLGPEALEHVRKYHPDDYTRRSARAAWLNQDRLSRPLPRPGPRTTTTPR